MVLWYNQEKGGGCMDAVNKTLFIPLYGKALVSQKGILLRDPSVQA